MKVRIPYRLLESALRPLIEADEAAPAAAGSANAQVAEKSVEEKFKEKVDTLNSMKDGSPFSTADAKFEKRSGSWYMVSAGGRTGLDTDSLLSLVRPDQVEVIRAKMDADRKSGGTIGITIQGNQFEPATTQSATFQLDNGYWKDMTPVPVEILAQYDFQVNQGIDTSETAAYAAVHGASGQGPFTYTRDEIVYLITKDGALYILAEGNKDNTLEATRRLITKVDPSGRIASTGSSGLIREKSNKAKLMSMLETLRTYLPDTSGESQNRFDVAIKDLKGLGELQKAIADQRTLVGKFVDLFGVNEIEMTFVMSQWGPAFMRAQVFGGRGARGGAGGLTSDDISGLMSTGLFIEASPQNANVSSYIPDVSDRQILIRPFGPNVNAPKVTVTPLVPVGVKVEGTQGLLNALQEDRSLRYNKSFADAYFLYANGVLTHEGAPASSETQPLTPAPAKPKQPKEKPTLEEFLAKKEPIGDGAFYFAFDKFNASSISAVADYKSQIEKAIDDLPNMVSDTSGSISITVISTSDPAGSGTYNTTLAKNRSDTAKSLINVITAPAGFSLNVTYIPTSEDPWPKEWANINNKAPGAQYLRFSKAFWGNLTAEEAKTKAKEFADSKGVTVAVKESYKRLAEAKIRAHIRRILLDG